MPEPDELASGADIGRRLGVSRQRVHQWARTPGFPQPAGRFGRILVWRWADVERWNRGRDRRGARHSAEAEHATDGSAAREKAPGHPG